MEKNQKSINTDNPSCGSTPYDDVFRTLVVEHKELVLRLINEMFPSIHYDGDEEVKQLNDTYFFNQDGGQQSKKIADSAIEVTSHDGIQRIFHLECQSTPDNSMIIRMFEYDVQIAIKAGSNSSSNRLDVKLPESGVLYLRSNSLTPDFMTVFVHVPGGRYVDYKVPILKLINYSCDDILNKELYFLIPFYLFNFESEFDKIETGKKEFVDSFKARYREIYDKLKERYEAGLIDARTHQKIIELSKKIIIALANNKYVVREEAEKIMGGQVLVTETETVYKAGQESGKEELDILYSWLKDQNRTDDILRAIGDKNLQNELLEEYKKSNC